MHFCCVSALFTVEAYIRHCASIDRCCVFINSMKEHQLKEPELHFIFVLNQQAPLSVVVLEEMAGWVYKWF